MSAASQQPPIRVGIIGAGIGGLTLANGLINDPQSRYAVTIYERDTAAFDSERGGYVLRIANNGFHALKSVSDPKTWRELQDVWRAEGKHPHAPTMTDPKTFAPVWRFSQTKMYPQSLPIARTGLKSLLLRKVLEEKVVKFRHTFSRFEIVDADDTGKEHKIIVHFEDPATSPPAEVDVLIAADGSRSRINQQLGLKNKTKLGGLCFVQARAEITAESREKLPQVLLDDGSLLIAGGLDMTGFVSVYDHFDSLEQAAAGQAAAQLFWALVIPESEGKAVLEEGKDKGDGGKKNYDKFREMLAAKLVEKGCDPAGFPAVIRTEGVETLRLTNQMTSSFRPSLDWRGGEGALSRIILLGDAIHPMTPGRGMGANQTLVDAANLAKLMASGDAVENTDAHWKEVVHQFDTEMFDRAFKMVKASEDMTSVDVSRLPGRLLISVIKAVLTAVGWTTPLLSLFGLYRNDVWV